MDGKVMERRPVVTPPRGEVAPLPVRTEERTRGAYVWGVLRLFMGWTFLWTFLDKAFALGFSTGRDPETGVIHFFQKGEAWFNGGSPTLGVLQYGLKGPFKGFYDSIAGVHMTANGPVASNHGWICVAYMLSMLLIGLGLMAGIFARLAAIGGIIWLAIFYTATSIWPEHNPFLDDHLVYIAVLVGIVVVGAGRYLGLCKYWGRLDVVKRHPILA